MSVINLRDTFYIRDIAAMCGITEEAVRQWCRSGALKSTVINREYHILFSDLADHFANNRRHLNFLYNTETNKPVLIELKRKLLYEIRRRNNDNSDDE